MRALNTGKPIRRSRRERAKRYRIGQMTVFVYVNTRKQVGDADHVKVFANVMPRKVEATRAVG